MEAGWLGSAGRPWRPDIGSFFIELERSRVGVVSWQGGPWLWSSWTA